MNHSFSSLPLPVLIHVRGTIGVCTMFQGKKLFSPPSNHSTGKLWHLSLEYLLEEWIIHVTQKYKDSQAAITFIYIKEKK